MSSKAWSVAVMMVLAVPTASTWAATPESSPCYLTLTQHRTGQLLTKIIMTTQPVQFSIEFIHSVLNTRVRDTYEMRANNKQWRAHLIEEQFEGQGYGLPYAATGPTEYLERDGEVWRLTLDRVVDPLVQLPLPEQQIDLVWNMNRIRLGSLSTRSVHIALEGCQAD